MRYKLVLSTFLIFLLMLVPMQQFVPAIPATNDLTKDKLSSGKLLENSVEYQNFDFKKLVSFLENYKAELDSFPLRKGGDGYINATFYGVVTLMLLGSLDKLSKDNLEDFLEYSYNEETGGFRDWLGGKETVVATAYGVLLKELLDANITEFNDALTRKFLIDNVENSSLYGKSLALIALKKLAATENVLEELSNEIKDELNNLDKDSIVDVFWAYVAIRYYDPAGASNIQDVIKDYLLEKYDEGGFGTLEKNVFETGLALELLKQVGYENKTLVEEVIKFVNQTQAEDGGVIYSINSSREDVFSAFGAVLIFYASGKLLSMFSVSHIIEPSQQIPIDYPYQITFKFDVKSDFESSIEYLKGEYNITDLGRTGDFEYVPAVGYEVFLPYNASQLGFGNHTVLTEFYFDLIFLHKETVTYEFSFRIGYNITITLGTSSPSLNSPLSINISVKYYNGTFVNAGELTVRISHKLGLLYSNTYNLSITPNVSILFNISEQPLLGVYTIEAFVNDSHGYNHTLGVSRFTVSDDINTTIIQDNGNRTLGSELFFLINVTYRTTRKPLLSGIRGNNVTISAYFKVADKEIPFDVVKWISNGTIVARTNIFNFIPNDRNVLVYLKFEWDQDTQISVMIANITISLDDLKIHVDETELNVNIGDLVNFNFSLVAKKSGVSVENASIKVSILNESVSLLNISSKYNSSSKKYVANIYINPDMLEGEYSIAFVLSVWGEEHRLGTDKEVKLSISGKPALGDYDVLSNRDDEEVVVKFTVVREGTNITLSGLTTLIQITKEGESIANTTASDLGNGTYLFGFIPKGAGEYNITILRVTDNYTVGSMTITVVSVEEKVTHTLSEYAPTIIIGVMVAGIIAYFVLSYYLGRKVPRRYLRERHKSLLFKQ